MPTATAGLSLLPSPAPQDVVTETIAPRPAPPPSGATPSSAVVSASPATGEATALVYEGFGSQLLAVELPVPGAPALASITYSSQEDWRHFSLWAFDDEYRQLGLLVNTLGSFSGTAALDLAEGDPVTSYLGVDAAGAWTIRIDPVSSARRVSGEVRGSGPDTFLYTGDTSVTLVANQSSGRFALRSVDGRSPELLVDQIGMFESEIVLPGDRLVVVQAQGAWVLSPQPPSP